jgi:hypothetical protein
MAIQKAQVEWNVLQFTEQIMEEINWRVIDNGLKDEVKSPHEAMELEIERGKRRDHLYTTVVALTEILLEPGNEENHCSIARGEPEEKMPTTVDGMEKPNRPKELRHEELDVSFNLNWAVTHKNVVEQVIAGNWMMTKTGSSLWIQCEKLRELILSDRTPLLANEDRVRMHDATQALAARGNWHMDPGTTYHRKIKKMPNTRCPVPTEDVERNFRGVWNPTVTPENTYRPPKSDITESGALSRNGCS